MPMISQDDMDCVQRLRKAGILGRYDIESAVKVATQFRKVRVAFKVSREKAVEIVNLRSDPEVTKLLRGIPFSLGVLIRIEMADQDFFNAGLSAVLTFNPDIGAKILPKFIEALKDSGTPD